MSTYHPAGSGVYTLSGSISSTATSITLSSFTEPVSGTVYTMANLNTDIAYGTIAPKTDNSEFISFTGITANVDGSATLTGVTRGLAKKYPFTTSSTFKLPHPGQSQFILSDAPQVFEKYVTLENAETITGLKTFPAGGNASAPVSGASYTAPTNDLEYASKKYVDDIAIAGAPDASTTVKGIVEEATQAEVDAGTAAGGTSARLFINPSTHRGRLDNDYAVDSVGTDAYAIAPTPAITAYVTGQRFIFKAGTANTGGATLAVSGLTAKAIVKNFNAALETGDIRAGQVVTVVYESVGDNFQLQTSELVHVHEATTSGGQLNATNVFSAGTVPTARLGSGTANSTTFLRGDQTYVAPVTFKNGVITRAFASASGAVTTAHGLGKTPLSVRFTAYFSTNAAVATAAMSTGVYNGTTTSTVYIENDNNGAVVDYGTSSTDAVSIIFGSNSGDSQKAVATFDATNITLTWTKVGTTTTGNIYVVWEAMG